MKKQEAKKIRDISERMGESTTRTYEWVPISGEDLLLCNMKTMNGIPVKKDSTYEIRIPVFHRSSLKKSLKRAWAKNGNQGIYEVVKKEHSKRMRQKAPTN